MRSLLTLAVAGMVSAININQAYAACNNDGTCDSGEDTASCPNDCPAAAVTSVEVNFDDKTYAGAICVGPTNMGARYCVGEDCVPRTFIRMGTCVMLTRLGKTTLRFRGVDCDDHDKKVGAVVEKEYVLETGKVDDDSFNGKAGARWWYGNGRPMIGGGSGGGGKTATGAASAKPTPTAGRVGSKTFITPEGHVMMRPTLSNLMCVKQECDGGHGTCKCVEASEYAYDVMGADQELGEQTDKLRDRVGNDETTVAALQKEVAAIPRPPTEKDEKTNVNLSGSVVGVDGFGSGVFGNLLIRANLADALPYLTLRGRAGGIGPDVNKFAGGLAGGLSFQLNQWGLTDVSLLAGWDGNKHGADHVYGEALVRHRLGENFEVHAGISAGTVSYEVPAARTVDEKWRFSMGAEAGFGIVF